LTPGAYTYTATYTPPTFGADFNGSSQTGNLTINQATPPISWQPASPVRYNVPITTAQLDATSTLPGAFGYTDASSASVVAGTYVFAANGGQQLDATFTPTDSTDYASRTVSRTIQVLPDITKVLPTDSSGSALSPACLESCVRRFDSYAQRPGFCYDGECANDYPQRWQRHLHC
jgi:hypothetical protein